MRPPLTLEFVANCCLLPLSPFSAWQSCQRGNHFSFSKTRWEIRRETTREIISLFSKTRGETQSRGNQRFLFQQKQKFFLLLGLLRVVASAASTSFTFTVENELALLLPGDIFIIYFGHFLHLL